MDSRNDPKLKVPLFLALDLDDPEKAVELAEQAQPYLQAVKVGPRLTFRMSEIQWQRLTSLHKVFWDHKYLDIPSTMVGSLQATLDRGASWATVHALAGPEALAQVAEWEREAQKVRPFQVLVVTVLTSFSKENLPFGLAGREVSSLVKGLAADAYAAGLRGFVCSPFEVADLKGAYPDGFFVTPGVRVQGQEVHDQRRVMTPEEALKQGSSALVMGRAFQTMSLKDRTLFFEKLASWAP